MKKIIITLFFLTLQLQAFSQCWRSLGSGSEFSVGIKMDGTLWSWGLNSSGQLGLGLFGGTVTTPTQIGTETSWKELSAGGKFVLALKNDGSLWAWGSNEYGALGDNTLANKNVPTKIGTANNWAKIFAGPRNSFAIKTDGTLWSWGDNGYLQLGQIPSNYKVPTKVGLSTDWSYIDAGVNYTAGLKTDGTLWTWGYNNYGQLGDNSAYNVSRYTPTQVGTDVWVSIGAGSTSLYGIKPDGTMWATGNNYSGQLGVGMPSGNYGTKVFLQIGTDTDWQSVYGGGDYAKAIKTNGFQYAWGINGGQFGGGGTGITNVPIQIGTATWQYIVQTPSLTCLNVKTDGSLWGSGWGSSGQLGQGNYNDYSLMVEIACPGGLGFSDFTDEQEVYVYPNPADDILYMHYPEASNALITIKDMTGKTVLQCSDCKSLSVSELPTGVYLVTLSTNNATSHSRFLKK